MKRQDKRLPFFIHLRYGTPNPVSQLLHCSRNAGSKNRSLKGRKDVHPEAQSCSARPRAGDRSAAAASSELKRVVSLLFFLLFIVDKRSSVPPSPIESEREKSSGQHIFEDEGQRDSDQARQTDRHPSLHFGFGVSDCLHYRPSTSLLLE